MSEISMNRMLSDLQRLASQAQASKPVAPTITNGMPSMTKTSESPGFGDLLTNAVNSVNNAQQNSATLKKAFDAGMPGIDLPQVMVASQKASVAFDAMLTVRKQLLEAYHEVMRMQV